MSVRSLAGRTYVRRYVRTYAQSSTLACLVAIGRRCRHLSGGGDSAAAGSWLSATDVVLSLTMTHDSVASS